MVVLNQINFTMKHIVFPKVKAKMAYCFIEKVFFSLKVSCYVYLHAEELWVLNWLQLKLSNLMKFLLRFCKLHFKKTFVKNQHILFSNITFLKSIEMLC